MADELLHVHLALAHDFLEGRLAEPDLPPATAKLPPLNQNLLEQLAQTAERLAATRPRLGVPPTLWQPRNVNSSGLGGTLKPGPVFCAPGCHEKYITHKGRHSCNKKTS